jgi:hypothetical protein
LKQPVDASDQERGAEGEEERDANPQRQDGMALPFGFAFGREGMHSTHISALIKKYTSETPNRNPSGPSPQGAAPKTN